MSQNALYPPVDWDAIHRHQFISVDKCWETCGGGYCCASNHADFQFRLLPVPGVVLLYPEEEYNHLVATGRAWQTLPGNKPVQRLHLDVGGPRPLTLVHMPCRLQGKCAGVIEPPLQCKLYPFLPVLDVDGNILDVYPFSIFELTFATCQWPMPCTLWHQREQVLQTWRNNPELIAPLKHPLILLYLQVARIIAEMYSQKLKESPLMSKSGSAFWKEWEILYLSGAFLDGTVLRQKAGQAYHNLVSRWGNFLTLPENR
ncbi:MAG: hypothetical protein G8345_13420 [Magnetococcales bacterium]|nr:hypothetical protein [Magnetococcales bacterium]NGZ27874.1 hypothetical protein [Magnetococcales bacterium]